MKLCPRFHFIVIQLRYAVILGVMKRAAQFARYRLHRLDVDTRAALGLYMMYGQKLLDVSGAKQCLDVTIQLLLAPCKTPEHTKVPRPTFFRKRTRLPRVSK